MGRELSGGNRVWFHSALVGIQWHLKGRLWVCHNWSLRYGNGQRYFGVWRYKTGSDTDKDSASTYVLHHPNVC